MIQQAFEHLDAAMLFIDCTHRIQWMNRMASASIGYTSRVPLTNSQTPDTRAR